MTLPYVSAGAPLGAGSRGTGVAIGAVADPVPSVATTTTSAPSPTTATTTATRTTPPRKVRRRAASVAPAPPTPTAPTVTPTPPTPPATSRPPIIEDDFWAADAMPLPEPPTEAPDDALDSAILDTKNADAAGWSDLAVLDERVALRDKTRFSAKAHPLGAWMRNVDEELRRRWTYPETFRALGIKGNVVVQFRVLESGVVDNVRVAVSSNIPELDLAALAALPKRVAAPPGGKRVQLQYVFRYGQDQR